MLLLEMKISTYYSHSGSVEIFLLKRKIDRDSVRGGGVRFGQILRGKYSDAWAYNLIPNINMKGDISQDIHWIGGAPLSMLGGNF